MPDKDYSIKISANETPKYAEKAASIAGEAQKRGLENITHAKSNMIGATDSLRVIVMFQGQNYSYSPLWESDKNKLYERFDEIAASLK